MSASERKVRVPELMEKVRKINQYHVQQFASFIEKMKSTQEGDGTLLDNSMIVYGAGLADGNAHLIELNPRPTPVCHLGEVLGRDLCKALADTLHGREVQDIDAPNLPWEATKFPGIKIKVLYSDDSGVTTALFKLDPGAIVPLHEHTALEQTYVIEGTLEDHEGVCGPGQFVWRPAGNQHEAVAPNGAVILGFFLKPNRFAYGEKFFTEAGER